MSGTGNPDTWYVGDQDTVIAALDRAVASHPDRVFLDFSGELHTYRDIDLLSTKLAHSFATLGVKPGETVVSMLDNNVDAVVCWLAVNKLGAVSVPINTALRGEFLRHQIADADTPLLICEQAYLERVSAISSQLTSLKQILVRGALNTSGECAVPVAPLDHHRGENDSPIEFRPAASDLACLIYTSGTTGPSKGCMISYNFMCNLARLQLRAGPVSETDVTITPLPLFHMNALCVTIIATMLVGARAAILPRFSVSNFWPEVERSGATIASILGGMGGLLA